MTEPGRSKQLLPHLLKAFWGRRVAVAYPFGPMELAASYRGRVVMDIDACIGCGRCARDCPAAALEVERGANRSVRVKHYYARCATCGQCELSCARGAIRLVADFRAGAAAREDLVVEWAKEGPAQEV